MERWFTSRLCRLIMDPNSIQTAAAVAGANTDGPVYSNDIFNQKIYEGKNNNAGRGWESGTKLGNHGAKGGCLFFGKRRAAFNDRTNRLQMTHFPINNSTDFTIEFWLKSPNGFGNAISSNWLTYSNAPYIFDLQGNDWFNIKVESRNGIECQYRDYPYNLSFQWRASFAGTGGNGQDLDGNTYQKRYLDDGRWHHYAFVLNGTTFHGFVDGYRLKETTYNTGTRPSFLNEAWAIGNRETSDTGSGSEMYLSAFRITTEALYTGKFTPTFANTSTVLTNTQTLIGCGTNPLLEQARNKTVTNTGVIALDQGPDDGSDGNRGMVIWDNYDHASTPTLTSTEYLNRGGRMTLVDTVRGGESYNYKHLFLNGTYNTGGNSGETDAVYNPSNDYQFGVNFHANGIGCADSTYGLARDSDNNINGRMKLWQYACKEGFLDIVTYTGNGSNRSIAHAVGSSVGMMWIKKRSGTSPWKVYMAGSAYNKPYRMNHYNEGSIDTDATVFYQTPTSTHFSVGTSNDTNQNGETYVAYIWGDHNYAKFGENSDQQMLAYGYYDGNASATKRQMTCGTGWKPAQVIIVPEVYGMSWFWDMAGNSALSGYSGGTQYWQMWQTSSMLEPYHTSEEFLLHFNNKGFVINNTSTKVNGSGVRYFWFAIRDHDGLVCRPPAYNDDVFDYSTMWTDSSGPNARCNFYPDFCVFRNPTSTGSWRFHSRLFGKGYPKLPNETVDQDSYATWGHEKGFGQNVTGYSSWMWRNYKGFQSFLTLGTGSNHTFPHQLGSVPEMIFWKKASGSGYACMYHKDMDPGGSSYQKYTRLINADAPISVTNFFTAAHDINNLYLGGSGAVNDSNDLYLFWLFASVEGFSKCSYYTGSGSDQTITCGFKPRFVFIRAVHNGSSFYGNDYLWLDSFRSDERLTLNSTSSSSTQDDIDYVSNGFTVKGSSSVRNANGYRYVYYAHA